MGICDAKATFECRRSRSKDNIEMELLVWEAQDRIEWQRIRRSSEVL